MTTMTDQGIPHPTHAMTAAMIRALWNKISPFSEQARADRQVRKEHDMLMAMSNHELHDIGMTRGDVSFGIASGRGVFRDADR